MSLQIQTCQPISAQNGVKGEDRHSVFRLNDHGLKGLAVLRLHQLDVNRFHDFMFARLAGKTNRQSIIAIITLPEIDSFKGDIAGDLAFDPVGFNFVNGDGLSAFVGVYPVAECRPILGFNFSHDSFRVDCEDRSTWLADHAVGLARETIARVAVQIFHLADDRMTDALAGQVFLLFRREFKNLSGSSQAADDLLVG